MVILMRLHKMKLLILNKIDKIKIESLTVHVIYGMVPIEINE